MIDLFQPHLGIAPLKRNSRLVSKAEDMNPQQIWINSPSEILSNKRKSKYAGGSYQSNTRNTFNFKYP